MITIMIIIAIALLLSCASGEVATNSKEQQQQRRRLLSLPNGIDLNKGKALADELLSFISTRFQVRDYNMKQFVLEIQNIPDYGWDIVKYKVALKILTGDSSFLMVFGGSSVTAGHDNYHVQSYPYVFERRMRPIFEAVGVQLIVRNIAHGASNCRPADYCYQSMGGGNADFLLWEQSFNCGRDKGIFEFMARVAYWQGAVLYYMASGGIVPHCPPSTDAVPWISEQWTPEKVNEPRFHLNLTLPFLASYKHKINAWFDDGNSAGKFSGVYGPYYKAVGPHGFNFWAHSSSLCDHGAGCDAASKLGTCHATDGGLHWQTAEASYYAGDPHKRGKNWHPPAGMHLLRGELLAFLYVRIVADAILQLQNDTSVLAAAAVAAGKQVDYEPIAADYRNRLLKLRPAIPENALYNTPEESRHPPHCFTDFEPHYNPPQRLSSIIMSSSVGSSGSSSGSSSGNSNDWQLVRTHTWSEADKKYGYLDIKTYYETTGANREIHFMVKDVRMGAIRVCGYYRKESLKHALFFLDPNYPFSDNIEEARRQQVLAADRWQAKQQSQPQSKQQQEAAAATAGVFGSSTPEQTLPASEIPMLPAYVPTKNRFKITERQYAQDECTRLYGLPNGDHVLTVQTDPNFPSKTASISHVIVF